MTLCEEERGLQPTSCHGAGAISKEGAVVDLGFKGPTPFLNLQRVEEVGA